MATAGPNYPSNPTDVDPGGGPLYDPWGVDVANVGADDGTVASCDMDPDEEGTSYYLDALGYGFSIPSATIDGITVEIERRDTHATIPRVRDLIVQLIKNGTPVGDNKADLVTIYPSTLAAVSYGGVADLWGVGWSTAEVNAANFGVRFQCIINSGTANRTAEVDFIRITITYTEGGGGGAAPNRVLPFNGGSCATSISTQSLIIPINMPTT